MSGKSAMAKQFKGFTHLENAQHLPKGPATEQQIAEAEQKTLFAVEAALSKGQDVVVSNCFSKLAYMYPFISAAIAFNASVQIFEALKPHRATLDFTADEMDIYRREFESILSVLGKPSTPAQIRARKANEARLAKIEAKRVEREAKKAALLGKPDNSTISDAAYMAGVKLPSNVEENKAIVEAQVDHAVADVPAAQAEEIRSTVEQVAQPVYENFFKQSLAADAHRAKIKEAALAAGARLVNDMVQFDSLDQLLKFQTDNIDLLYPPVAANGKA